MCVMNPTVEDSIFMYLVYNQGRFKIELSQFVKQRDSLLKSEDSSFHEEIQDQFKSYALSVLVDNVTKHLAISSEDAIIVIENVNLDEYLTV